MRYDPDSWANKGLSVDGGSLLLNLFMDWSLSEGLMHKGIIRLLKGVFMDKHSVSLALDMCVVALGHLKGINPGHSLFDRQCKIIFENVKTAKDLVSDIYSRTTFTDCRDTLEKIDDSLAEVLGYLTLYQSIVGEESLMTYAYSAMEDAAVDLMDVLSDACDYVIDDEDSELEDMVFNGNEELDEDGIIRLWKCDDEDIVEE